MRCVLFFAACVLACLSACGSEDGQAPAPEPDVRGLRQITVTGTGVAAAEPDLATIVFGVDVTANDPALAVADAGARMNAAMAAAREQGVAGEDLRTTSYNLWSEEVYDPRTYRPTGQLRYRVSHFTSADVRDVTQVGAVLAAIVGAGVNSVSGVSYGVADRQALQASAASEAVADARARADSIAAGLGVTVGRPLVVGEYTYSSPDMTAAWGNYGFGAGEYAAPPVSPGSFTVTSSVTVTFEIE